MQKRKRLEDDPILPLRAPKHPRLHRVDPLGPDMKIVMAKLSGLGQTFVELFCELLKGIVNTSPSEAAPTSEDQPEVDVSSSQPQSQTTVPPRYRGDKQPPSHPSGPHNALPPRHRNKAQSSPQSAPPTPPLTPPRSMPTVLPAQEQQAGPSNLGKEYAVLQTGLLSPPESHNSDSDSSAVVSSHPQITHVFEEIGRRNSLKEKKKYQERRHIYHSAHKRKISEERKKKLVETAQDGYRRAPTGSLDESYFAYRRLLQNKGKIQDALSPSASLINLRERRAHDEAQQRRKAPDEEFHRALERAGATLRESRVGVTTPKLDQLRKQWKALDTNIERRIRGPKLPTTLPPEDEASVNEFFSKRGVVAKCVREQVTDKDISRLRPRQWLNDEIINFYGQMIMSRSEECKENPRVNGRSKGRKKPLNVHYFSTFFWPKLQNDGYERGRLAKWTKKFDIFSKDVVLIPVNHSNAHWTAAAINFRCKRIEAYDSMGMPRHTVFKLLREYLDAEHRNKRKTPFDFTGWEDYDFPDTPQQENGYDCGVFTCQFLESLSRGEETFGFDQSNMAYLRRRMVWEIGNVKLRDDA